MQQLIFVFSNMIFIIFVQKADLRAVDGAAGPFGSIDPVASWSASTSAVGTDFEVSFLYWKCSNCYMVLMLVQFHHLTFKLLYFEIGWSDNISHTYT